MLNQVPSVLDRLQHRQIPERERPSWLPAAVVAILGDNQGRRWGNLNDLAVSPDGKLLALALDRVQLWDAETLRERVTLPTGSGVVAWHRQGKVLVTADREKVLLWDVNSTPVRLLATLKGHSSPVRALVFTLDGKALVSSAHKEVIFWDVTGQKPQQKRRVIRQGSEQYTPELLSPNGLFVVESLGQPCRLWRLAENADAKPVLLPKSTSVCSFSPDGKKLITGSSGGSTFILWDLSGAQLRPEPIFLPTERGIGHLFFSPDGEMLVRVGVENVLEITPVTEARRQQLGLPRGQMSRQYQTQAPLSRAAFLPDGKTLILGGRDDSRLRLFDFQTGKDRSQPRGHRAAINVLSMTADGRTLATADMEGEIRLWDLASPGSEKAVLKPPVVIEDRKPRGVRSMAFSPDGRFLLSTEEGKPLTGTVQIWDLSQPNPIRPKIVPAVDSFAVCVFSSDGKTVVVEGWEKLYPDLAQKIRI